MLLSTWRVRSAVLSTLSAMRQTALVHVETAVDLELDRVQARGRINRPGCGPGGVLIQGLFVCHNAGNGSSRLPFEREAAPPHEPGWRSALKHVPDESSARGAPARNFKRVRA